MDDAAPEAVDYESQIVSMSNSLAFLPPSMRNARAERYINQLSELRQSQMLDFWNFGVAVLVFRKQLPDRLQTPEAEILRDTWSYSLFTLKDRFVDVGVLGEWQVFREQCVDYDIAD